MHDVTEKTLVAPRQGGIVPPHDVLASLAEIEAGHTIAAQRIQDAADPSLPPRLVISARGDFGMPLPWNSVATAPPPSGHSTADSSPAAPNAPLVVRPTLREGGPRPPDEPPSYRFLQLLGRGGQGEVWRAVQASLARDVAVKIHLSDDHEEFYRESFTSGALDHPNIVPVHDVGVIRDERGAIRPMLAMKLVDGQPWNTLIESDRTARTFSQDAFLAHHLPILLAVCNAVAYAHSKGIIHRDLKPAQVMLGAFGEIYLVDWGLAICVADPPGPADPATPRPRFNTLLSATNPCGTPAYMAPEQTDDTNARLGFRTDVYLLGAILYDLVAGRPPHAASSSREALIRAVGNEIDPLPPDCPDELRALLRRSLASEPSERLQTVGEFRTALEEYVSGAGRQRESRALFDAAARELEAMRRDDYDRLTALGQQLGRAIELWPGNLQALHLRDRLAARHAEAALREGDLRLARSLAAPMREEAARDALLTRIEVARQAALRAARQRRQLAVASAVLLLVVVVGGVASWQGIRAERDAARAAQVEAEKARGRAETARGDAEDLISFMLGDLRDRLAPIGRLGIMDAVARQAKSYYDQRGGETTSADAVGRRALALSQLAELRIAQGRLDEARAFAEEGLDTVRGWAGDDPGVLAGRAECSFVAARVVQLQGNLDDAEAAFRTSLALYRQLHELDPDSWRWRAREGDTWLAIGHVSRAQGELGDARTAFEHDLRIKEEWAAAEPDDSAARRGVASAWNRIGDVWERQGNLAEANAAFRKALAICEALSAADSSNAGLLRELGIAWSRVGGVLRGLGDLTGAQAAYERDRAILERLAATDPSNSDWQNELADSWSRLAGLLESRGDLDAARAALEKDRAIRTALAASDPSNTSWQRDLGALWTRLGGLHAARGSLEEARHAFDSARAIFEALVASDPSNTTWQRGLGVAWSQLGDTEKAQGNPAGAHAAYTKHLAICEALIESDPTNAGWQRDLGAAWSKIGRLLQSQGRLRQALESYQKDLAISERLAAADPLNVAAQGELASSLVFVGGVLELQGKFGEARAVFERYLAISERLAESDPSNTVWRRERGTALVRLGSVLQAQGSLTEAHATFERAHAIRSALAQSDPSNALWKRDLASSWVYMGGVLEARGRLDAAREAFRGALALREELAAADPTNAGWQRDLALAWNRVGDILQSQGNLEEAQAAFERSLPLWTALEATDPGDTATQRNLGTTWYFLGSVLERQGKLDEALAARHEDLAIAGRLAARDPSNAGWRQDLGASRIAVGRVFLKLGRTDEGVAMCALAEEVLRPPIETGRPGIEDRRWWANCCVLRGRLERAAGREEAALAAWSDGIDALQPIIARSASDPLILDPYVTLLMLSGHVDDARPHLDRLRTMGYHNADVWTLAAEHGIAGPPAPAPAAAPAAETAAAAAAE